MKLQISTAIALMSFLVSSYALPKSEVTITTDQSYRYIQSNGIPDHATGQFPNAHNPNTIRPQNYHYRVPLHPRIAAHSTPLGMYPFGVAVDGVPFDPLTNEFWDRNPRSGWRYDAISPHVNLGLDQSNAHVQPNGAYHYHGVPWGLVKKLPGWKTRPVLVGYAADGFPIYAVYGYKKPDDSHSGLKKMKSSYRLKQGMRPSGPGGRYDGTFDQDYEYVEGLGDLDACNGRFGVTPEYPDGIYQYYVTEDYPFVPRCFRGVPDPSFFRRHPPPPFRRRR